MWWSITIPVLAVYMIGVVAVLGGHRAYRATGPTMTGVQQATTCQVVGR